MRESNLWPHQARVHNLLANGHNVILQAPTGSGKTRAALYPFLCALDPASSLHDIIPAKCLYAVPMRILAKQFHIAYEKTVASYRRRYGLDDVSVSVQTGEQGKDRELAHTLTFATIDQVLSSFLLAPYSLPSRLANLNAAAVMASYLVFDEFHLYDPISTLPTALHMLQILRDITPFVLMTATFSAAMLDELAGLLGAEVVPGNEDERQAMLALAPQQKTRRYWVAEQPLSARQVLDRHTGRSLVICNTVDRARQLYEAIQDAKDAQTEAVLLHSRFLREDRDRIEDHIRTRFAQGATDGSLIVISTQAIEVGVDITSTALHTELAPANSILQRAGRCARYQRDEGDVYIYPRTFDPHTGEEIDLIERVAPYMQQEAEFAATLATFRASHGSTLSFLDEQAVINTVHGPRDRQILDELKRSAPEHRRRMYAVMRRDQYASAPALIRNIQQQRVTIHAHPNELLDAPFDAPAFGLHPGTLMGYVTRWLEAWQADESIPWAVKWLKQYEDLDADQANDTCYKWIEVCDNPQQIKGQLLVVVHPRLATYDPARGFLPDRGGVWQAKLPERKERDRSTHSYRLETYADHIRQVHRAAFTNPGYWHEVAHAAQRLEERYGWEPGSLRRATELAVLLHDVGKLSTGWQGWVRAYQQKIGLPVSPDEAYAHTDSQSPEHQQIARSIRPKRPWHAVEGAIAVAQVLLDTFGEDHPLFSATFSAIARHHAPGSNSNRAFKLIKTAMQQVAATLDGTMPRLELLGLTEAIEGGFNVSQLIIEPQERGLPGFLAYLLIVRVLRRADQRGTERGARGDAI